LKLKADSRGQDFILTACLLLLSLAVLIRADVLLDRDILYTRSPDYPNMPAVAAGGSGYLVAWADERGADNAIYATRLTGSGEILDSAGIFIASRVLSATAVGWDGSNYFVLWDDARGADVDVYGARVSPAGLVLDPGGIPIARDTGDQGAPTVAFDGTNFLVAWQDHDDIAAARVTSAGLILDPDPIRISNVTQAQHSSAVGFDGQNFLVIWERAVTLSNSDIYGARVAPNGRNLDTAAILIAGGTNSQESPAVAFGANDYFVIWREQAGAESRISGRHVGASGAVLDSSIAITQPGNPAYEPKLAFDGFNYLVVWKDNRGIEDVYGTRVTVDGTVLEPNGIPVGVAGGMQGEPAVTSGAGNFLAAWADNRNARDIYAARVTPTGTVLDPTGILSSTTTSRQDNPSLAFDGVNYLVAWEDNRNGNSDIYGTRVSSTGVVLDPQAIPICTEVAGQFNPAVTFDGNNYLVVWEDYRGDGDIYGALVTPGGTVLQPNGFTIHSGDDVQETPDVVFGGIFCLVVWTDWRSEEESDIYASRVNQFGAVLDSSGIAISRASLDQSEPRVSFDGTNYLVAWTDERDEDDADIRASSVDQAGDVIGAGGSVLSNPDFDQSAPAVAFDGAHYFVAWQEDRLQTDIAGTRVSTDRQALDPAGVDVCSSAAAKQAPVVVFDGANYLVAWQHLRPRDFSRILGARVDTAGQVLDTFDMTTGPGSQLTPALARGAGANTALVYSGWTGDVEGRTYNTMRIWLQLGPFPGVTDDGRRTTDDGPATLKAWPIPFRDRLQIRIPQSAIANLQAKIDPQGHPERSEGPHPKSKIRIYDSSGRLVRTLPVPHLLHATCCSVSWDGTDNSGRPLPAGVYLLQYKDGNSPATRHVVLQR
jgi:large repetitive protein